MPVNRPFYLWLRHHPLASFLLMTLSFIAFGYLTLDLVRLIGSNTAFIVAHGWVALVSGGLLPSYRCRRCWPWPATCYLN